ncbi:DNA polymerase III subunit epsilon [Paracoccaceae bacterium]|nr:DNA polymerase III subunit epsilon [Paracoccaceae bacterium]
MREIVLDTETTGLYFDKGDRVVEIGAIELINHVPTGSTFHTYINPQLKGAMPTEAYKVHGLTLEFLSNKPIFSEIINDLLVFLRDSKIIIHNARFDIGFLNSEIQNLLSNNPTVYKDLPYTEIKHEKIIDTLELARKLYPGKSVSLDSLCTKFGVDNKRSGKHGALVDSEILSEVYLEMIGGKQPGFLFSTKVTNNGALAYHKKKREKFKRKSNIDIRLTDKEKELHKKFVMGLKGNFWSDINY